MATCRTRSAPPSTPCSTALPADPLRRATASLIDAYRSGAPPTAQVLRDPTTAAAYAAYRMPATHAAVARALRHATDLAPGLEVRTVVDVGGGTGAATWAVAEAFPALERATVLDGSTDALALGARIGRHGPPAVARCQLVAGAARAGRRAARGRPRGRQLPARRARRAAARAGGRRGDAAAAAQLVLVVEPGTPRGYAAVLAARSRLTDAGWHLLAPCPQDGACPVAARPGDWCHFAVRLDRSALHRRVKGGRLGHEDEKFSYVLASRAPVASAGGRGAAASGHPQGARAARGLRLRRVRGAGRGDEARPDRLPCSTRRLVGGYVVRAPAFASVDT